MFLSSCLDFWSFKIFLATRWYKSSKLVLTLHNFFFLFAIPGSFLITFSISLSLSSKKLEEILTVNVDSNP